MDHLSSAEEIEQNGERVRLAMIADAERQNRGQFITLNRPGDVTDPDWARALYGHQEFGYAHPDPSVMPPEPVLEAERQRQRMAQAQPIPPDRPAVFAEAGQHDFVPSEFAPESGRCDRCGGGALAQIHQKPVDQMARIADALERIADVMEDAEQTAADRLGADSINNLVRGLTKAEGM